MDSETFKERLKVAYETMRAYAYHVFTGLTSSEINWIPDNTKARTIQSYVRHMVNTEVYWLEVLGDTKFNFLPKETSFDEIVGLYKSLEAHYLDLLKNASIDDLRIIPTKFDEADKVLQRGSLAWTIIRVTLHAFGHVSHINHIRYSLENPPIKTETSHWWEVTENMIKLCDYGF